MSEHSHVILGRHELPIYEQAPMRIIKRIGRLRDAFLAAVDGDGEFDPESLFSGAGERVYDLFVTFIPNLPQRMPEFEFWGYSSRDAYDADELDEDEANEIAAKFTQWLDAFEKIVEVHGGKRFLELVGKVLPPDLVRAEFGATMIEWRESIGSRSLPSPNGASPQTSSGTNQPGSDDLDTEDASASDSQTEISSGSRQPITA